MNRRHFMSAGTTALAAIPFTARADAATRALTATPRKIVSQDGMRLAVRCWGEGRPVLFAHSWAMASGMWDYQVAHLAARGMRCITFDRRGHGQSDAPADGYDMDSLADDLAAVVEALDLRGAMLVGHSMGCAEIVRCLARHGSGRVERIALLCPTTPFLLQTRSNPMGIPGAIFEQLRSVWQKDFPGWIEANRAPFFRPDTSAAMMDWLVQMMLRTPLPVAVACNRAAAETDFRPDLAKIDRPTLVIHGTKDASADLQLCGLRTAEGIRGSVLKVYDGAPHGLFVTDMARVNADLAAFAGL